MVTEVILKRELLGGTVSQKSKSEFFSATDLERIGNKWRVMHEKPMFDMNIYFKRKSTIEFMEELESRYNTKVKINSKGKNGHTWIHPLLFIDMALEISPTLKIEVYEWIFDKLIQFRNDSGDSYKEMCGALYTRCSNLKQFPVKITDVANAIRTACGAKDWETATKKQLEMRDNIHRSVKLLCRVMTDIDQILRIAIEENIPKRGNLALK
jgi:hypothetical protein